MRINLVVSLIFLLSMISCSTIKMESRSVEDYYASTGVEKYFLENIPIWNNFDQRAFCQRNFQIRYFDINLLMKSYGRSYIEALQIQASFNEEYLPSKKMGGISSIKEEEILFYKVSDKVAHKIVFFDPPLFKRINIIWVDEILEDLKKEDKFKKLLNSSAMEAGVPVFLSFCLTKNELEKKLPEINAPMITAEIFSAYQSSGEKNFGLNIEIDKFFNPDQQIYLYSQKSFDANKESLKGIFKYINY